jgi:hypothetical protein
MHTRHTGNLVHNHHYTFQDSRRIRQKLDGRSLARYWLRAAAREGHELCFRSRKYETQQYTTNTSTSHDQHDRKHVKLGGLKMRLWFHCYILEDFGSGLEHSVC